MSINKPKGSNIVFGGSGDFIPTDISGAVLWLRADLGITKDVGDGVSLWEDQSTEGVDYAQSSETLRPLWVDGIANGHPIVRGNGTSEYLSNAVRAVVAGNGDRTVLLVYDPKTNGSESVFCDGSRATAGGLFNMDGRSLVSTIGGSRTWTNVTADEFNYTITNCEGGSVETCRYRINGGAELTPSLTTTETFDVQAAAALFGMLTTATIVFGNYSDADIAEIVVYDRSLTSDEEDELNVYAAARYAI
jgi:hypothetical protein